MTSLAHLGWDPFFRSAFQTLAEPDLVPARVCIEHNHLYRVRTDSAELLATASGTLKHAAARQSALPGVGDWVAVRIQADGRATIRAVLPRRTCFSRKAAGPVTAEQVVAANIDTVLLVSGLDGDFNPRRVQRYLAAAAESGATPVVVLNKADLCADLDRAVAAIGDVSAEVTVHCTSCQDDEGLDRLRGYLKPGRTIALLGSSGVGKSTIINRLLGVDRQPTRAVRAHDGRGRHTTVHRELLVHPDGGVIIDTPGMRELRVWDSGGEAPRAFDDIDRLTTHCRFRDCQHRTEPGCAVRAAVEDGRISKEQLRHYHQLQDERAHLDQRRDELASLEEKQRQKRLHRGYRRVKHR